MKKILEIHQVDQRLFELNLEDFILTFDDGLYSQYKYIDQLCAINTTKIFFISTEIVAGEGTIQNPNFITCSDAHQKFFKNKDKTNYMKWSQIIDISKREQCIIGGHSHSHKNISELSLKEKFQHLQQDTVKMFDEFKKHGLEIQHFCFPYNQIHPGYQELLRNNGIKYFYGNDREKYDK